MPSKTLKSKLLGTLKYDKRFDWWSTKVQLGKGHKVEVTINNIEGLESAMDTIDEKIDAIRRDDTKFREFAARKLLKLANEWSDGEKVTKEDFISRMRLETVAFDNELSIGLYYDDGGLFLGHTITVDIDKDGRCTRAEFHG
jgi:hypothetical protein